MAMESAVAGTEAVVPIDNGEESLTSADHAERISYDTRITAIRKTEYPMLKGEVYLDHAGTTLPSASLLDAFALDIKSTLYGNPHSFASLSSQASSSRIDDVRLKVLRLFNADVANYDVVFVANATAGIKLVAEAFVSQEDGFDYIYHQDAHTSVVGARETAKQSMCLEDDYHVEQWLTRGEEKKAVIGQRPTLFAFPSQSNMDGRRLPLRWCKEARESKSNRYVLLDAAGLVSTSTLDLNAVEADFVVVSFYKMFGFPDLGALIVRKGIGHIFNNRRYFGGGTVETVACAPGQQWHIKKMEFLHQSLEDGTLPIHGIVALDLAIDNYKSLFGGFVSVSRHVDFLTQAMYEGLKRLYHWNGKPLCKLHSTYHSITRSGPVIAFNLLDSYGEFVSNQEVHKLANIKNIHLRTGNLCNPGGVSRALGIDAGDLLDNYSAGLRCGSDRDILTGRPTGVIRISLGAMSTMEDVDKFLAFLMEFFLVSGGIDTMDQMVLDRAQSNEYYVDSISIYPIKSCGGYQVPPGIRWKIGAEGLAWDREWCLVHQGTGKPLNQKRYPKLALFRPTLDLQQSVLHVQWSGDNKSCGPSSVSVPLIFEDMHYMSIKSSTSPCRTYLCAETAQPIIYQEAEVSDFFSHHLEAPVYLARSPRQTAAIREKMSFAKPSYSNEPDMPGTFPTPPPSPPNEQLSPDPTVAHRSLANESPILVLFLTSLASINAILPLGSPIIHAEAFRANIVLGSRIVSSPSDTSANLNTPLKLVEDTLKTLSLRSTQRGLSPDLVSGFELDLLAPCRRCQMIAIDQTTGERRPEIFAHLAKVRRFDGGVWFGVHARLKGRGEERENAECSTRSETGRELGIGVGDGVTAR